MNTSTGKEKSFLNYYVATGQGEKAQTLWKQILNEDNDTIVDLKKTEKDGIEIYFQEKMYGLISKKNFQQRFGGHVYTTPEGKKVLVTMVGSAIDLEDFKNGFYKNIFENDSDIIVHEVKDWVRNVTDPNDPIFTNHKSSI